MGPVHGDFDSAGLGKEKQERNVLYKVQETFKGETGQPCLIQRRDQIKYIPDSVCVCPEIWLLGTHLKPF